MSILFSKFNLKNLEFKNRIVMPPMCMYSATTTGQATDFHIHHYSARAAGGVGAIILEATAIEPRGRISENDLGIWSDEHLANLKEIVEAGKLYQTVMGIQLAHAGRKNQTRDEIIAPSPISFPNMKTPIEMTVADINQTILLFQESAKRALQAGFDFIEIHAAHGYLINEFLSPLTNHRQDIYGGTIENRSRILKEIIQAIRIVWPKEKVLGIRISADEYDPEGNQLEDVIEILKLVVDDLDFIDVSSGGVVNTNINIYPGYQLDYAKKIKEVFQIPVIAGGLITDYQLSEYALNNHQVDFIYLGRQLLRNPYFALQEAKKQGIDIDWPKQYQRAK